MTQAKKPAPEKRAKPKKKTLVATKSPPEMISYAIKMVIPTVAYGNIQPEIIVKANSIDEAHDFIVPHMNKLWKEYYLVDGRRPEPTSPVVPTPVAPPIAPPVTSPVTPPEVVQPVAPPASSVALVKATQAIESCMGLNAMHLISNQVKASVKLTDEDKKSLQPLINEKYSKLLEAEFNNNGLK